MTPTLAIVGIVKSNRTLYQKILMLKVYLRLCGVWFDEGTGENKFLNKSKAEEAKNRSKGRR
jgi:hypothetical protein